MTSADQRKTAYVEIQKYMRDNQFVTSLYETDYIMAQSKILRRHQRFLGRFIG